MFRRFQKARLEKLGTAKLEMANSAQVQPLEVTPEANEDTATPVALTYPNRYDRIARRGGISFTEARARHAEMLDAVNARVGKITGGGQLIATPYCPTACAPGPIAEFLTTVQCDPFQRSNMFYCASDPHTAAALDTQVYAPELAGQMDAELVSFYQAALQGWRNFQINKPNATDREIITTRNYFQLQIARQAQRVEKKLFGTQRHLWRSLFQPVPAMQAA